VGAARCGAGKESAAGVPDPALLPAGYSLVTASKVIVLLIEGAGYPLLAADSTTVWRSITVSAVTCRTDGRKALPRRLVQD